MDRLAIVILNWNGCGMLETFLPKLISCSAIDSVSIVVADNSSTDNSVGMMRQKFPDIRLVLLDRNYGFAGGYNLALRQIEAEYYMLLNSDVEVTEHWLEPMLDYMDRHSDVAACQPKLLDYSNRQLFEYAGASGGFMDKWGYLFCRGRIMDSVERDNGQYDKISDLFWATGAALLVRSSDYRNLGGFDERFFAHQEEVDLCWRLRSRGRRIVCVPQSIVFHVGGATLNRSNPYKTFLNFRNNLLMLYKNLPGERLRKVMFVRFWLDMLAALMFVLQLKLKDACAVFRARREFRRIRPEFEEKRNDCQSNTFLRDIPEMAGFSLLWWHYVRRVSRFSDLHIG